ncbi:hypothetical protein DOS79_07445 [Staphylococcus felis]|nr:hypothetical protein DOS79_07445 [Staphylococcus felis]
MCISDGNQIEQGKLLEKMKDLEAQIRTMINKPKLIKQSIKQKITTKQKKSEKKINKIAKTQQEISNKNETSVEH